LTGRCSAEGFVATATEAWPLVMVAQSNEEKRGRKGKKERERKDKRQITLREIPKK
jgi:hypothetical protein